MTYVKVKQTQPTIVATCLFKTQFFYAHRRGENPPAIQPKAAYSYLMVEKKKKDITIYFRDVGLVCKCKGTREFTL